MCQAELFVSLSVDHVLKKEESQPAIPSCSYLPSLGLPRKTISFLLPAALAYSVRQKDRIHCFSTVESVCSPFQFALSKEIRSGPCCPAWVCTTRWRHNVWEDADDLIHNVFLNFFSVT